jgi:hypothetical protein
MGKKQHEQTLLAILTAAVKTGPEFMTNEREASALILIAEKVVAAARDGYVTVTMLSVLAQQALRLAACGWEQSEAIEKTVDDLVLRTVGKVAE